MESVFIEPLLSQVLAVLRERTGVDFSLYRLGTVQRRIHNRMISLGLETLQDYVPLLDSEAGEAERLAERIAIKVSRFYRNPATFDLLRTQVLPRLSLSRAGEPLRIWSIGCGFGEEAYTLAMLLEDAGLAGSVEASDIDTSALAKAETGIYRTENLAELPTDFAARFMQSLGEGENPSMQVRDCIRSRVRFFRHDVTSASPAPVAGRFDLIACRNVLIYLGRTAQQQAFGLLLDHIDDGGFVCLGEAEWPSGAVSEHFTPLDKRSRLFSVTKPAAPSQEHSRQEHSSQENSGQEYSRENANA